jgi:uncharacterized membrane protein (UPF0127 family)
MFTRRLPANEGLLLTYKRENRIDTSIHMLGMLIDLGIVWINGANKVVDVRKAYKWRSIIFPKAPAKYVLEITPEAAAEFKIGDEVVIE